VIGCRAGDRARIGGALRGAEPGIRLFEQKTIPSLDFFKDIPEAFVARKQKWILLPQYHVFGSSELSVYTKAIGELSPEPYIGLSKSDAEELGKTNGSVISVIVDEKEYKLPLKILEELSNGIVLIPKGFRGLNGMSWGSWVKINEQPHHD